MFNKWGAGEMNVKTDDNGKKEPVDNVSTRETVKESAAKPVDTKISNSKNTILKGSKLTGDINVTCDLELSGDVEGNITSTQKSNIVIKGTCKGNIEAREGNVDIEGELKGGNITAGNDVKITGKFNSGEIKAKGKIYVNGEFNGKLEGNEVEIGSNAHGKGEILYKEYISIAKGARVEAQISRMQEELKVVRSVPENKPAEEIKPQAKQKSEAE